MNELELHNELMKLAKEKKISACNDYYFYFKNCTFWIKSKVVVINAYGVGAIAVSYDNITELRERENSLDLLFEVEGCNSFIFGQYQDAKTITVSYRVDDEEKERHIAYVTLDDNYLVADGKRMLIKECNSEFTYRLRKTFIYACGGAQSLINYMRGVTDYDHVHPQAIVKWILQYGK